MSIRELNRAIREDERLLRREQKGKLVDWDTTNGDAGARSASGFSIAALAAGVLGVVSFFVSFSVWNGGVFVLASVLLFVAAVVFGAIGMRRSRRSRGGKRGLAIAGFILGLVGSGFYAFILALILSFAL